MVVLKMMVIYSESDLSWVDAIILSKLVVHVRTIASKLTIYILWYQLEFSSLWVVLVLEMTCAYGPFSPSTMA